MDTDIQKTGPISPLASAAELVSKDGNMDVAKLKELLDVQERWEANEAKKAFMVAMAEFKVTPPEILKDQTVSYKQTSYKHASLHNVTSCINKALSEHGLTASWVTSQDKEFIKVTCKITHIMGHSEETSLTAAPDTSGSKNPIQAIGSTVTYLQRYTLLALVGLATSDQDDDGAESGKNTPPALPTMTTENKHCLKAICAKLQESLPEGKVVDTDKVAKIMLGLNKGVYPSKLEKAPAAAAILISMKQPDSWAKETGSAADDAFAAYSKHYFKDIPLGHKISRERFNSCAEGCNVPVDGTSGAKWAIANIPLKNTLIETKG